MLGNSVYRRLVVAGSAAGMCLVASPLASGDEAQTPDVAYVSEDWVLVLNEPASSVSCPQFHTIMSPTTDLASRYFQVNWNYQEQPSC